MTLKSLESLLPYLAVAYTMWATPGPNNMMLTYSGAKFGLKRCLPHIFGIITGTFLVSAIGILGLKPIIVRYPLALEFIKIIGSGWLLWIGWKMANAKGAANPKQSDRPLRFIAAMLLQFVNPKAITSTFALASLVFSASKDNILLLTIALLLIPPLCFLANAPWALAGQSIRRFLSTPFRWRLFAIVTGFLTAACALFIWL